MPLLMAAVSRTDGDVVELGTGAFSTPVLHWMCYPDRKLVSYESNEDYYKAIKSFKSSEHEIHLVKDWNKIRIQTNWGVAFVDHAPAERRKVEISRLANYARFVVIHDSEEANDDQYHYSDIYPSFKFRYDDDLRPRTTVLSNFEPCNIL